MFEKQLAEVGQQLIQVQGRLSKLFTALETGKVDIDDLAPRIKELRAQQKELEDRQNRLLDERNNDGVRKLDFEKIQEYAASLKSVLASNSFLEQKSFLRSFIKRIELKMPQVVIDYTVPLPIKGLNTTEEVLCIDKAGPPEGIRTKSKKM